MISLFFLLLSLSYYGQVVRGDCTFNFTEDVSQDEKVWSDDQVPVYLARLCTNETEFLNLADKGRQITIQEKRPADITGYESLILWCPGRRNGVGERDNAAVELICRDGSFKPRSGSSLPQSVYNKNGSLQMKELSCVKGFSLHIEKKDTSESTLYGYSMDFSPQNIFLREDEKFRIVYEMHTQALFLVHYVDKNVGPEPQEREDLLKVVGNEVFHPMLPREDLISPDHKRLYMDESKILMPDSVSRNNMFAVEKYIRKKARESKNRIKVKTGVIKVPYAGLVESFVVKEITDGTDCSALLVWIQIDKEVPQKYQKACGGNIPPGLNLDKERSSGRVLACSCKEAKNLVTRFGQKFAQRF